MCTSHKPSVPRLARLRKRISSEIASLGIAGEWITGLVRERLVQYAVDFVEKSEDYTSGADGTGDGPCVDELGADKEHRQERRQAAVCLLSPFAGLRMDPPMLRRFAICLSGRRQELRDGNIPLLGWTGEVPAESLLWVRDIHRLPAHGRLYFVALEAFTGPPAGQLLGFRLTGATLQRLMRIIGATKFDRHLDEDVSGMWFVATMRRVQSEIRILRAKVTDSQLRSNRALARGRRAKCTGEWAPQKGKSCIPCPVSRKVCWRSRYETGWDIWKPCRNGHDGLFRKGTAEYCWRCTLLGKFDLSTADHASARCEPSPAPRYDQRRDDEVIEIV